MHGIRSVTLLVADYDEAIRYFVGTLGFELVEDTDLGDGKRWVRVRPAAGLGTDLLLAEAVGEAQRARIGDQTGGRVAFFLEVEDFETAYRRLKERGVSFEETPRAEAYGTVAVFRDLYGNRWDLIQTARP